MVLLLLAGCMTAPVIVETGYDRIDVDEFPRGTRIVSVEAANGEMIRGVFVPAGPHAPVVLQFLERSGSITTGGTDMPGYPIAWDLRGAGLALLCFDYRGVGISDGEASPENFAVDARAAWREAVARAGGDPSRVVLRGLSMGAWPVCALLDDGKQPAAVVLSSPVRAETAVGNVADSIAGSWFEATLAKILFKRPVTTDIVATLGSTRSPRLVIVGAQDDYLPRDERELLRKSVRNLLVLEGLDHRDVVGRAHALTPEEDELYARLFPDDFDRNRPAAYVEPERVARLLAKGPPLATTDPFLAWARGLCSARIDQLPDDALAALLSLEDPSGPLDQSELRSWQYWILQRVLMKLPRDPAALVAAIKETKRHDLMEVMFDHPNIHGLAIMFHVDAIDKTVEDGARSRLHLPEPDRLRQAVLWALKMDYQPARAIERDDRTGIEVWSESGGWAPIDLD